MNLAITKYKNKYLIKINDMICAECDEASAKPQMSFAIKVLVAAGHLPSDVGTALILDNEAQVL